MLSTVLLYKDLMSEFDSYNIFLAVILTCSLLEDPEFGRVVYEREDRMVGSSASYRCEAGYTLIGGESERVCLENQTWSSVAATCERESYITHIM